MGLIPPFFTVQVALAPLPFPFMQALTQIEVETSTDEANVLRLSFDLSRTPLGDWDVLQFDIFRPLAPLRVMVALGFLPLPETLINAFVRDARLRNSSKPGESTFEVVALDATATLMNHIQQPMTWPNMADSDIAALIFGKYGMAPNLVPTPPARTIVDTTSTQRASDIRYLKQLSERNAYECYVQPDPLVGLDMGHFHPPLTLAPPQGILSSDFGSETNLTGFNVSNDMLAPTSALAVALDPNTGVPVPTPAFAAIDFPMGIEPTLARILLPPIERPAGADAANPIEMLARAQSRVHRSSRCVQASGEVDGTKFAKILRPGLPVNVRGVGRLYSGTYYVTNVTHRISRDAYSQSFTAWRNALGLTGAELFIDPMAALA